MRYLRIFSWFLFTFGIVGFGATVLGIDMGIGTGGAALTAMALQVIVSGAVLWGFKLHEAGKLHREVLMVGGWLLLVVFIVLAQVLVIMGQNREGGAAEPRSGPYSSAVCVRAAGARFDVFPPGPLDASCQSLSPPAWLSPASGASAGLT